VVPDGGILDQLGKHRWSLRGYDLRGANPIVRLSFWTGALVATLLGFYFGLPLAAEPVAAVMPVSWEERLGRAVRDQVFTITNTGENAVCRTSDGQAALQALVDRLERTVDTPYTFRVVVVDHSLVNAFAAPGGYIVVFRGLIDEANSAEEVAGVVAHEMGHVVERHTTESLIRAIGTSLVLSAVVGDASTLRSSITDFGTGLLQLSHTRNMEREADDVGIRMMNQADIRGDGLADFFARMAERHGDNDGLSEYMSTHPSSTSRAEAIRAQTRGSGPAMTDAEWTALQNICGRTRRSRDTDNRDSRGKTGPDGNREPGKSDRPEKTDANPPEKT
jgi:predicted Zn-dependent protease